MIKSVNTTALKELKEKRTLRFRHEVSSFTLVATPLKSVLENVKQALVSGIAKHLNNGEFKEALTIKETSDYGKNTKIFSADIVVLTTEEFDSIAKYIANKEEKEADEIIKKLNQGLNRILR